eukprot:Sspe_Gene.111962::Locus_94181_Transcript_1_1_Confidence_1.000_Length_605::g.111962::m.111962/K21594/GUF1; translation factor GUF1, mitochondrial
MRQVEKTFGVSEDEVTKVSSRSGLGIATLLQRIIHEIPPPRGDRAKPLRCFLFDASYRDKTLVAFVLVVDGVLEEKLELRSYASGKDVAVKNVGILFPDEVHTGSLFPGQVGWVTLEGEMSKADLVMGDTLYIRPKAGLRAPKTAVQVEPFKVIPPMKPTVYANVFGAGTENDVLERALHRLCANDPSVEILKINSKAMGT